MRKRATPSESLDQKIEKAQAKVIRTKAAYDKAVDELQILLDKALSQQTVAFLTFRPSRPDGCSV